MGPRMTTDTEEECYYVHCRKCGDTFNTGVGVEGLAIKQALEKVDEEPLKGRSLFTCRPCIYSMI